MVVAYAKVGKTTFGQALGGHVASGRHVTIRIIVGTYPPLVAQARDLVGALAQDIDALIFTAQDATAAAAGVKAAHEAGVPVIGGHTVEEPS